MKESLAKKWLPTRKKSDNKSQGGKVLIWAGSKKMPGAAILAAQSASRCGAGYIYLSEKSLCKTVPYAIPWNKKNFNNLDAILIGPGLGIQNSVSKNIEQLKIIPVPVIIDADALTVAANNQLTPFPPHWIATPHPGELSRLLNLTIKEIQADRLGAAVLAQKKLNCIVVVKGFRTIVAFNSCHVIIPTGNVTLAKGGSGDVLAGMIAGFIAQKVPIEKAVLLSCFLHGQIADAWVKSGRDYLSMTPSDLIESLPFAISSLRKTKTTFSSLRRSVK